MNFGLLIISFFAGAFFGAFVIWVLVSARFKKNIAEATTEQKIQTVTAEERLAASKRDNERLFNELEGSKRKIEEFRAQIDELSRTRAVTEEKLAIVEEAKDRMTNAFKALSAEALKANNQVFLELAKTDLEKHQTQAKGELEKRKQAVDELVKPLREALGRIEEFTRDVEKERKQAYGGLTQQVKSLEESQQQLQNETANLVKALRAPQTRGRWGEITLRRVAEMAGMVQHCDFEEQVSTNTDEGRLRPDMVVRLPNNRQIVVDAKASLQGYLDAYEATNDEDREAALLRHARHIREHVSALSNKTYWAQFNPTPDFVVLFIPGESFYSAAIQKSPELFEDSVNQRVLIATPTTLIALLRAVAYGWSEEALTKNAEKIRQLGQEIYDRLAVLATHFAGVGKSLDSAIESYNRAIGNLETRVLVSARQFKELGVSTKKDIPLSEPSDKTVRAIQSSEIVEEQDELQETNVVALNSEEHGN